MAASSWLARPASAWATVHDGSVPGMPPVLPLLPEDARLGSSSGEYRMWLARILPESSAAASVSPVQPDLREVELRLVAGGGAAPRWRSSSALAGRLLPDVASIRIPGHRRRAGRRWYVGIGRARA